LGPLHPQDLSCIATSVVVGVLGHYDPVTDAEILNIHSLL